MYMYLCIYIYIHTHIIYIYMHIHTYTCNPLCQLGGAQNQWIWALLQWHPAQAMGGQAGFGAGRASRAEKHTSGDENPRTWLVVQKLNFSTCGPGKCVTRPGLKPAVQFLVVFYSFDPYPHLETQNPRFWVGSGPTTDIESDKKANPRKVRCSVFGWLAPGRQSKK